MSLATRIAQEFNNVYSHVSAPTAYHIYNGSVEATNTILTNGFSTTLYTGNGGTQSINTGVDMATQWGDDASETYGGLVWIKSRTGATKSHNLYDTVKGSLKVIFSDLTNAESTVANSLTNFNNTGFVVGSYAGVNANTESLVSWNFQTTHRKTGVTNHGKAYTEHYNPYTGFTIIKYEGSGLAGHEIPHSLGRKLGFVTIKNLSAVGNWCATHNKNEGYYLNLTNASIATTDVITDLDEHSIVVGVNSLTNTSAQSYILYGWANSYFDEDNTLIGNYEIGVYQGTAVPGNKVTTRGKPAWIMIKRLDSTGDWKILDTVRKSGSLSWLSANLSDAEGLSSGVSLFSSGFIVDTTAVAYNASGGQYLYMVVYDNDSGSGKSKYPKATDTTNLSINALVPYANGIDVNGSKVSIEYKNETITGLTLTQGKNYVYSKNDGTYGVNKYEPMYGSLRDRVIAEENPDYFDLKTMKWYGTSGGEELVTNGTFSDGTNGWTALNATLTVANNILSVTDGGTYSQGYQGISTTIGDTYIIEVDIADIGAGGKANITYGSELPVSGGAYEYTLKQPTTVGTHIFEYVAQSGITYIGLGESGTYTTKFNSVSVFKKNITPTIGAEITPRTYLDCIVYADQNGQVSYVEELPKTQYVDEIKANEYKGKNSCTAWVNFDGTTTPPTIRDSYNVKQVVRTATGIYDVYFEKEMGNENYAVGEGVNFIDSPSAEGSIVYSNKTVYKLSIGTERGTTPTNAKDVSIHIFGGHN